MSRFAWIGLVVAAVLAVGAMFWFQPGTPVEAAAARRDSIRQFVDEQGTTRLPETHRMTMPYEGRIAPIALREGDAVKKGQEVAQFVMVDVDLALEGAQAAVERLGKSIAENDDASVELTGLKQAVKFVESMDTTVKAAQNRVRAGQAKLELANNNLERTQRLLAKGQATQEQLEAISVRHVEADVDYHQDQLVLSALTSMQAATSLLPTLVQQYIDRKKLAHAVLEQERAEAQARLAQRTLDKRRATLVSPVDGIVLERFETNERLMPGGTPLLTIGEIERLEIEIDVLSQDVVDVRPGQEAEIYGPAVGPKGARGTVDRIYPAGFTKVSSLGVEQQRVKVIVRFAEGELSRLWSTQHLSVGYRVRARIVTDARSGARVIPRSSLFRSPSGQWQVFAVRRGRARLQAVEIGLLNDEQAEVTSGLEDDEEVVLAPESNLVDGAKVRVIGP